MSILNAHLTDAETNAFGQANLDEFLKQSGVKQTLRFETKTFFLNPETLKCNPDMASMEAGALRKAREILPAEIVSQLPPKFEKELVGLADLSYGGRGVMSMMFSRPNDARSLADAVHEKTGMSSDLLSLDPKATVQGFDNLWMIARVFQVLNCIPNGGLDRVRAKNGFDLIKFRSMLGAKREFMRRGGNKETIAAHEATDHIAAFTNGKISGDYLGFMNDFRVPQVFAEQAYGNVLDRLVALGYATVQEVTGASEYPPVKPEALLIGMTNLLDEYANTITANNGRKFKAFHTTVSLGEAPSDKYALQGLTTDELLQHTQHYIVFKTLKGLKTLMGKNVLKFVPERKNNTFSRISQLLSLRHS